MSHQYLSHPMNINTEKGHEDSLDVVNVITKCHFNFKWKRIKAAMDALVYPQDIYAKAKDKVDAKLQNIQGEYYDKYSRSYSYELP